MVDSLSEEVPIIFLAEEVFDVVLAEEVLVAVLAEEVFVVVLIGEGPGVFLAEEVSLQVSHLRVSA